MGLFDKLFGKKQNSAIFSKEELVSAGACPNCWGRQEYDGKFIDYQKDQTKSNINHDKQHQKTFIQQFVETNITGIKLKQEGHQYRCPSCKANF